VWSDSLLIKLRVSFCVHPIFNGPGLPPFILSEQQTKMWTFNADIGYNDTQVLYMYGKILINGEFILVYLAAVE